MIVRVEELLQRFGDHPVGATLFLNRRHAHIGDAYIDKPTFLQPVLQRQRGRDEVNVAHLRIAIAWHQNGMFIPFDDQRFQHQLTAADQLIFQLPEMLQRGTTVVQHAHREHGIKRFQSRELLDTQRQQVRALVVTQQLSHRFKLAQEQLHRIDTDGQMRACADHAPHVIAATAAHVQNGAPGQVG